MLVGPACHCGGLGSFSFGSPLSNQWDLDRAQVFGCCLGSFGVKSPMDLQQAPPDMRRISDCLRQQCLKFGCGKAGGENSVCFLVAFHASRGAHTHFSLVPPQTCVAANRVLVDSSSVHATFCVPSSVLVSCDKALS